MWAVLEVRDLPVSDACTAVLGWTEIRRVQGWHQGVILTTSHTHDNEMSRAPCRLLQPDRLTNAFGRGCPT